MNNINNDNILKILYKILYDSIEFIYINIRFVLNTDTYFYQNMPSMRNIDPQNKYEKY
jgi:hypothetical protein